MSETLKSIESVAQSLEEYNRIIKGRLSNLDIAEYYETMAEFGNIEKKHIYLNKARNIKDCHKIMTFDYYKNQGVKDYKSTSFCKDRFCSNCQKLIANTREQKFMPLIEKASKDYGLYNLTLTLKNPIGDIPFYKVYNKDHFHLIPTIKKMSKCFKKLIRYFNGDAKIKGLDFSYLGYVGAIRTLEITYNLNQVYHPHYHCILAMKKDLKFPGNNVNGYSYSKKKNEDIVYAFSDLEIIIQKIWYLILNDMKVTKKAIDSLQVGYSCKLTAVEDGNVHQTFKYIIKPEKEQYMSYMVFSDLERALHNMRQIQCYGIFFGLKIEDDDINDEFDPFYDPIIKTLMSVEKPVYTSESPTEIRDNILRKKFIYISRKSIRKFARKYDLDGELNLLSPDEKKQKIVQLVMSEVLEATKVNTLNMFDDGRVIVPKVGK